MNTEMTVTLEDAMRTTEYGPGDPETWGAPTGHPHDPRTYEEPDALVAYLDGVREMEQLARVAHARGDYDKAWQFLREIKAEVEDV